MKSDMYFGFGSFFTAALDFRWFSGDGATSPVKYDHQTFKVKLTTLAQQPLEERYNRALDALLCLLTEVCFAEANSQIKTDKNVYEEAALDTQFMEAWGRLDNAFRRFMQHYSCYPSVNESLGELYAEYLRVRRLELSQTSFELKNVEPKRTATAFSR